MSIDYEPCGYITPEQDALVRAGLDRFERGELANYHIWYEHDYSSSGYRRGYGGHCVCVGSQGEAEAEAVRMYGDEVERIDDGRLFVQRLAARPGGGDAIRFAGVPCGIDLPEGTDERSSYGGGEMGPLVEVDPRQLSLFGAGAQGAGK